MNVRINELKKGTRRGYKVRWLEDGKRKEGFRATKEDALALKIEVEERLNLGDGESYKKTSMTRKQVQDAEVAFSLSWAANHLVADSNPARAAIISQIQTPAPLAG